MRYLPAFLAVAILAGCGSAGGHDASPSSVVRAWSRALNAGDNDRAASLFAVDAKVVQGKTTTTLRSHAQAVFFNASLPCAGRIVRLERSGEDVTATFVLADRVTSPCDGPGQQARAVFKIHGGKIVLWHQLPSGPRDPDDSEQI